MASNAFDFALNAVDKVAGKKTRDQLENQVGNLAQSEYPLPFHTSYQCRLVIAQLLIWLAFCVFFL
jgi:hypothetical protein